MNKYAKTTPEGTRDYLYEECDARRKIESKLSALFKSKGYKKVITPTIEFFDVFNRDSAGLRPENMYSLCDTSGRLLVLRPDSTLPIARIAATRLRDAQYPLRLYYSQRVFRRCESFSGRSDETSQCGIELIGASGIRADLEILVTAVEALGYCGAPAFSIEIGHAGFFKSLIDDLDAGEEIRAAIAGFVETKNYSALNSLLDTLPESKAATAIRSLPRLFGGESVLDEALSYNPGKQGVEAINCLRAIYSKLPLLGLGGKIHLDLGLVHRSNYYTGVVFRGFIEGSGLTVLSGGRYDRLIGEFGRDLPATGFGVETDALAKAMLDRGGLFPDELADVLVFGEDGCEIQALMHANELNKDGLVCVNCLEIDAEKAKQRAQTMRIPRLDIVSNTGVTTLAFDAGGNNGE